MSQTTERNSEMRGQAVTALVTLGFSSDVAATIVRRMTLFEIVKLQAEIDAMKR
jgi:rRNA processing protein Krr1/Pno1